MKTSTLRRLEDEDPRAKKALKMKTFMLRRPRRRRPTRREGSEIKTSLPKTFMLRRCWRGRPRR
jgi:hypothetical protein